MKSVKVAQPLPLPEGVEPHVVALVGRLLDVARQTLLAEDWNGLRPSHFRLLSHVPPSGISISELGAVLHMTKQGVGQFVTQLQASGHLQVTTDQGDRRRRVVQRTARGDRLVAQMNQTVAALELHWQERVGRERYREFRRVLCELADVRDET
jgi:DNA-binding MarR family transcriptional regulator